MTEGELESELRSKGRLPESAHRERLEVELLAAFDARPHPTPVRTRPWRRVVTAAAASLVLATASQVPASYRVEVGERITVRLPSGLDPDAATEVAIQTLRRQPWSVTSVQARVVLSRSQGPLLVVDLGTDRLLPENSLREALRAASGLDRVEVSVAPLRGQVRDTLLGALGHSLFKTAASPAERERARRELIEEVRQREGDDAKIDVDVDPEGQRVRVKVEKPGP